MGDIVFLFRATKHQRRLVLRNCDKQRQMPIFNEFKTRLDHLSTLSQ